MPEQQFRVGRSKTGLGLFATEPIAPGALIVEYRGKRIATKTAQRRERRYGSKYMFEIDRKWTIDGAARENVARYVNHSCRPNADAVLRKGKMYLRAIRKIKPGEEIVYDYGEEYFDLFLKKIGCKCLQCEKPREPRRFQASSSL